MKISDLIKDYKEGMTLEEIETALADIQLPNTSEVEKLKNALSKYAETIEKLQSDYDALLKKVTVSENKAKLLGLGYEDSLATETSEAMANGEVEKVFANQKKHIEAVERRIRSEVLKETPKPSGGNHDTPPKKLSEMSYKERAELYNENPEEYKNLSENKGD